MEQICRLCGDANPPLTNIAVHRFYATEESTPVPLDDLIQQYLTISVNTFTFDPLICTVCLKRLEEWHIFCEQCQQYDRLLQGQKIKFEEVITTEIPYEFHTIGNAAGLNHESKSVEPDRFEDEFHEEELTHLYQEPESPSAPSGEAVYSTAIETNSPVKPTRAKPLRKAQNVQPKAKRGRPKRPKDGAERTKYTKRPEREPLQTTSKHRVVPKICTICGMARTDMAAHMRWHNNERPYQCPHCPKIFVNSSNLKNHVNLHTREKLYKCDLCEKQFPSTTGRNKHRETHATERAHLCAVCGKSFKYRASLARHKLIHFEEPKQKCGMCDMKFLTKTRLTKHMLVHMKEKPHCCDICGKAFTDKKKFLQVLYKMLDTEMRHVGKERVIELKIEPVIDKRLKREKPESIEPEKPDALSSENDFIAGFEVPPKPQSRKRQYCSICCKYLNNMAEHSRMHRNIRVQQCPYCEKTFVHRSNLYAHLNIHTRDRVYQCELCNSDFSCVQGLKQHRSIHFEAQFACGQCDRKFHRKSYLSVHEQRVHMPKQKHKCLVCDRQFLNLALKEQHMKIHENKQLYDCNVCRRAYNMKRNLLRHMRMAHPLELGSGESI
uniref:Protein krueppel n=1 Tax=Anopheles dirus TaxID=7168 RepID=A0A182N3R9_9DIPT